MATVAQILTYEEWLKLPPVEDGTDEVVKGELRFMPPTHYPHAEIIQNLIEALVGQIDKKRARVLGSNLGLMITRDPLTCRSPDLVVFWRDKMVIQDGLYWSAPGLVVEILSPSENRRRQEGKLADYAAIGVPEVWLVSPEAETIEICLLKEGKLERAAVLAGGSLQPSEFAGVTISVSAIFPE
jgi:Uma2 family endonuclease